MRFRDRLESSGLLERRPGKGSIALLRSNAQGAYIHHLLGKGNRSVCGHPRGATKETWFIVGSTNIDALGLLEIEQLRQIGFCVICSKRVLHDINALTDALDATDRLLIEAGIARHVIPTAKETNMKGKVEFYVEGDHHAVRTTATDEKNFLEGCAHALSHNGKISERDIFEWLEQVVEIACKLKGYKAAHVYENRILTAANGWFPHGAPKLTAGEDAVPEEL